MAGVLQFTLGLEASKFLGQIEHAGAALGRFMFDGVKGAIETGARLEDLGKRTGETVSNLYGLEKAFKAAGLEGGSVSTMLFQMNKALGGFSEFGTPTKDIFASLGLDVEKLKASGGAEALFAITDALSKLSQSEATKAGSLIFGRAGAGDAVQLSRSMKEARAEFEASGKAGAMLERNAGAFDKIMKSAEKVRMVVRGLFFGIAEGAAPGIQAVLDMLAKIDLKGIGSDIGKTLGAVVNAFKAGGISDVGNILFLSLATGAEKAANFISAVLGNSTFWAGIFQVAIGAFGALATAYVSTLTSSMWGTSAALFKQLGVDPAVVDATQAKLTKQSSAMFSDAIGFSANKWQGGTQTMGPAIQAGMAAAAAPTAMGDQLAALLEKHKVVLESPEKTTSTSKLIDASTAVDKTKAAHQASADSLTRIGFFQNGGNAQVEYVRQTATHTRTIAQKMTAMMQFLERNNQTFDNPYGNIP